MILWVRWSMVVFASHWHTHTGPRCGCILIPCRNLITFRNRNRDSAVSPGCSKLIRCKILYALAVAIGVKWKSWNLQLPVSSIPKTNWPQATKVPSEPIQVGSRNFEIDRETSSNFDSVLFAKSSQSQRWFSQRLRSTFFFFFLVWIKYNV